MKSTLSRKSLRGDILKIASPVFIELLMGTLFGMIDMMMLGRSGADDIVTASIAAVGITNQMTFIGISLVQSLTIGATTMIARYIGARKEDRIESVVKHVTILSQVVLVIPFLLIGLGFTDSVMNFLGAQSDSLQVGRGYFRVITFGFIFQAFNFSMFAALRGSGDTKTPMKINVTANLLNVFGNAILIYGLFGFPALGVLGAGISTVLSQIFASVLLFKRILDEKHVVHIKLKNKFKFDKDIIYNLVKIGLPAAMEQIALRAGLLIFSKIIAALGTVAYATHQICISILNLSFTPGQAFGISASTLTGRSLGEKEPDKAAEYIKECVKIGSLIAFVVALIFFFFGTQIASLYTPNKEIARAAGEVLKIIAIIQPFQCSQLILSGGLRGAGDTVWTLISTFFGILVIRLILCYILVIKMNMGLSGAWFSVTIDQFFRWMMIKIRFKTNKWKYITIR